MQAQGLDLTFVGLAEFVDFVAVGVAAGDAVLERVEGVEGEEVLGGVGLGAGDGWGG